MAYRVQLTKSAEKDLYKLSKPVWERIKSTFKELQNYPNVPGIKRLQGYKSLYRLRVGSYRVVFTVNKNIVTIVIVVVGHRGDIYKKLK